MSPQIYLFLILIITNYNKDLNKMEEESNFNLNDIEVE